MLADHIGVPQLRDLASRSEQIVDKVDVRDMSRVARLLHSAQASGPEDSTARLTDSPDGILDVEIAFHAGTGGTEGYPEIIFSLSGTLGICCQRCLGLLNRPLELDFRLVIVESGTDLDEIAETIDVVAAGEHGIELLKLIEDEILASLPFAPVHSGTDECTLETELLAVESQDDTAADVNRPFAGLDSLVASGRKGDQPDETD
jgi:uncharacterized protein